MTFRTYVLSALLLVAILGCASTSRQSLYDEIGGHQTLNTIFGVSITRIYTHPEIGHYFKGVPKQHLREQLVAQTCELIGGPCEYDGKSMLESHKDLDVKIHLHRRWLCFWAPYKGAFLFYLSSRRCCRSSSSFDCLS